MVNGVKSRLAARILPASSRVAGLAGNAGQLRVVAKRADGAALPP